MSGIKGVLQGLKPSTYPHFSKMDRPVVYSEYLLEMQAFVGRQHRHYCRITWWFAGLWTLVVLVGAFGLDQMLDGDVHTTIATSAIIICLVLIIPMAFVLFVLGSIAEQHGTWLKKHLPIMNYDMRRPDPEV